MLVRTSNILADLFSLVVRKMASASISFRGMVMTSTAPVAKGAAVAPSSVEVVDVLAGRPVRPSNTTEGRFVDQNDKRQESRRAEYNGFVKKMEDLKLKTGDEVMVVLYNADRQCHYVISSDPGILSYDPLASTQSVPVTPPPTQPVLSVQPTQPPPVTAPPPPPPPPPPPTSQSASAMVENDQAAAVLPSSMHTPPAYRSTPRIDMSGNSLISPFGNVSIPSIPGISSLLAATASPSNPSSSRKKRVYDESEQKNRCRLCNIEHESREDIETDSEWIGCIKDECQYWVHLHCKGFPTATEDDFENIDYYCPSHNPKNHTIRGRGRGRGRVRTRGGLV